MTIAIANKYGNTGYGTTAVQNILHEEYKGTGSPIKTAISRLYNAKNIVTGNTGLQSVSRASISKTVNTQQYQEMKDSQSAEVLTNYNNIGFLSNFIPYWLYRNIDYFFTSNYPFNTIPFFQNPYIPILILAIVLTIITAIILMVI